MARGRNTSGPVQADIARALGISVSTISRALADSPHISDDVRAQVRDTATRLGYRSRRTERHNLEQIVALVALGGATTSLSFIYQDILEGLKERSRSLAAPLEIHMRPVDDPLPDDLAANADERVGLLFVGLDPDEAVLRHLSGRNVPMALVNGLDPGMATDCVAPANFFGGRMVAEHLISRGHRRLIYVSGHARWTLMRRQHGFEAGVAEFGRGKASVAVLNVKSRQPERLVREIANFQEQARQAATAMFCSTDTIAIYAIQALQSLGLVVPNDMSVIGFDDMPMSTMISPSLTTVRIEWREIGREAISILQRRAATRGRSPMQVQIGGRLVVRDSVGSARRINA
ncbi:LacI family DNA-binding transcriptional regulator [Bauldia sp.]|uniref:LacI family DNA-binding transcriptional regulator n=1 Tax=Bauldia sp. TaxID=2575872 RepID=UPI003BAC3F6B